MLLDLNISGYTFLCSFLCGDLVIGFVNYNYFVRGAKTKGHVLDVDIVQ
jgi:hypothetical protein